MKRTRSYLSLQLKRAARLVPQMLAVTLLLAVLTAMAGLMLARSRSQDSARRTLRIGVVGDEGESLIDESIDMLSSMDTSRFSIKLERMQPGEADSLLRRGSITGYLLVPDGFANALWYGDHLPLTYFSNNGGADVGTQLTQELVVTISALVMETENAVYGAQNMVRDRLPEERPGDAGDDLLLRYGTGILDRSRLYQLELTGVGDSLSLPGYYLCGILLLFVMLWSISCSPLFSRRSRELGQILNSDGFGAPGQIFSEFTAFLLLLLFALLAAGLLAFLLLGRFGIPIPELQGRGESPLTMASWVLPPALMLCALAFLLYELSNSTVSGILLQFLNAAVQGYLAGCFYPSSFFPEGLRRVGALLPAGFAMRWLRAKLLAQPDPPPWRGSGSASCCSSASASW